MLKLYFHPFASFCQKVLIAFYEKGLGFEPVPIDLGNPDERERLLVVWPMGKFPVVVDEARGLTIPESSAIIEYVDPLAEPRLVPEDRAEATRARVWDRFFDGFVSMNVTRIVVDRLRPEGQGDPFGVAESKATIGSAYDLLEKEIAGRSWAAGERFTLADCSAAPALFYAGACVPMEGHPALAAYLERLLARPSVARVVEEARPYRGLFPLPWPDHYR